MRGGALLAAGLAVSNAFGYALNLVASRVLGPDEFGAFASLMGIVLVAFVGTRALQSVTARRLATDGTAAAPPMARLGRKFALGIAGGLALAAPAFSVFLHLDTTQVLLVAASMVPLTLVGYRFGLAQGTERFAALAVLYIVVAAGRLGGTLIGLAVRDSVTAGLVGSLAGASAAAVLAARIAPSPHPSTAIPEPGAARELAIAAGALFAFFGLTNVDVLLARHNLDGHEAGLYALGAVVGKGAFWFPAFIAVLAYPMLVDESRRGAAMRVSLALVAASGAVLTVATALAPDFVVAIIGGDDYTELADEVALFALAGSLYAVAQLLIYARLAQGDPRSGVRVAAVGVGLVLTVQLATNDSVTAIVLSVCAAAATLSLAGLAAEWRTLSRPAPDESGSGDETDREGGSGPQLDGVQPV
jgi:O-antigen/teichoic acid export membrane protein